MKSRTLHISQLITSYACQSQVDLFCEKFGNQVEVTVSLARRFSGTFDFKWAADDLLSGSARVKYDADRAVLVARFHADPLWAMVGADAGTWAKHHVDTHAALWAQYESDEAALWAECYINDEVPK